jgi:multiple sugar transport system substrate-binding protein
LPQSARASFLSRRTLLGSALAAAALPVLAACGGSAPTATPPPAKPAEKPAAPPPTTAPAAAPKPAEPKPADAGAQSAATKPPAAAAPSTAGGTVPPAQPGSSAARAIEEAKKFKGETITLTWEGGLQSQDPLLFSGPKFEELTGVKVKVVEVPGNEQFSKLMAEHLAGGGAFDAGNVQPGWLPDMVSTNAIIPLDDYIKTYMNPADLDDYLPIYKTIARWNGKYYGLFDDGDTLLYYYRKDLFEDPKHQADFKSKYGRDLGTLKTADYQQYHNIAKYFTETGGGKLFGAGLTAAGMGWSWYQCWLRMNGGTFFDPETMKPGINSPAAIKSAEQLLAVRKQMPPGAEQLDAVALFSAYLSGTLAIGSFWPPLGRWAEAYGARPKQLSFVPETQIAGKTGYALFPGGYTEMAGAYFLNVWSNSKKKDLAYHFIQWMTSPEVSLERVMLPYALRDPYRISHVESTKFRSAWPAAGDYLDTCKVAGSGKSFLDLIITGGPEYVQAYTEASTAMLAGKDVKASLDEAAAKWEKTTDRLGRAKQQENYKAYLSTPGATLDSLRK